MHTAVGASANEKGVSNEETYYNKRDEGRERDGVCVERKSEWEHCVPDGSAASPHLDVEIRSHCYFITERDPRSYNTHHRIRHH